MKNTMHGQKRCSLRPALSYKFQRSQQSQILSDVQEAWLCLPEQRNVNRSLKQRVDLCVYMDFFCGIPTEYPKAMPHFQTNTLSSFSKHSRTLTLQKKLSVSSVLSSRLAATQAEHCPVHMSC